MAEYVEFLGKKRRRMPAYPRIEMMVQHRGSVKQLCAETGISETAYAALQKGDSNPRKKTIDAILAYTDLTYEQAFGEGRQML